VGARYDPCVIRVCPCRYLGQDPLWPAGRDARCPSDVTSAASRAGPSQPRSGVRPTISPWTAVGPPLRLSVPRSACGSSAVGNGGLVKAQTATLRSAGELRRHVRQRRL